MLLCNGAVWEMQGTGTVVTYSCRRTSTREIRACVGKTGVKILRVEITGVDFSGDCGDQL